MYHTILTLRKCGHSQREIASELRISKTTVNKYCTMTELEGDVHCCQRAGSSEFAIAEEYIRNRLTYKPRLRSSRLYEEVKQRYPDIKSKQRAFRSFIKPIRDQLKQKKQRYFSVVETAPGEQMQIDPGEMKIDGCSNHTFKVYFTCFTLSYSRYVYVHWQLRPYRTDDFIEAHKQAFLYFEGIPQECVYDQTKLVVIKEKYGEVLFNEKFHHFALKAGFHPHICKKSDPQSKGKVERTVQEVKSDFLYGRTFTDLAYIRTEGYKWLSKFNDRIHSVTQEIPSELWKSEKKIMSLIPETLIKPDLRNADKTGLISYQGNKYSVPLRYQRKQVIVKQEDRCLIIIDQNTSNEIARHTIPSGKGGIIRNNNHYRDFSLSCKELLIKTIKVMNVYPQGEELVKKLTEDNPKLIRDQLRALNKLFNNFKESVWLKAIPRIMDHHTIRASLIERILVSTEKSIGIQEINTNDRLSSVKESVIQRSLNDYMRTLNDA